MESGYWVWPQITSGLLSRLWTLRGYRSNYQAPWTVNPASSLTWALLDLAWVHILKPSNPIRIICFWVPIFVDLFTAFTRSSWQVKFWPVRMFILWFWNFVPLPGYWNRPATLSSAFEHFHQYGFDLPCHFKNSRASKNALNRTGDRWIGCPNSACSTDGTQSWRTL